jgi:hypothetical protein
MVQEVDVGQHGCLARIRGREGDSEQEIPADVVRVGNRSVGPDLGPIRKRDSVNTNRGLDLDDDARRQGSRP